MRLFHRSALILCAAAVLVSAEKGCPYPEDVEPCTCTETGDYVSLGCRRVDDTEVLRRVFDNSRRYHFNEFVLRQSTLQYIPHEVFDDVRVKSLVLMNVTLRNMFDKAPTDPDLMHLSVLEVKILAGWDWKKLADFKNVEYLTIWDTLLKRLPADFRSNVSKKLRRLSLRNCNIKKLQDDVFADLTDVEKFDLGNNAIVDIKRTMFPRRTKVKMLNLIYNKISTVPSDMFSDMPFLVDVSLRGNMMAVLPEATFQPIISQLFYLNVEENPIKCDCLMAWVLEERRDRISGKCYAPKALRDKPFDRLTRRDIRC
ncbi:hypothetical protein JTE90_002660 [Oedothorax gibbosus]|uniref:Uncharacterized protein n=1 Tax=Oedothorax gibbosus TaxID=931172 RepID=A0AAV6UEQ9_9ARAC|nr:hypothetical protein JTE90_002660 [Oedothorax gibbosus]